MARIRSIHPGFFTDEAVVSVSAGARVLLLGIWTQCDDQGVFEWKPVTLKMRVLPADNYEVEELLDELAGANIVKKLEVGGASFGLVRNFRKWQRPKKPNSVYVLPDEFRTYVGLSTSSSELDDDQPTQGGEPPPSTDEPCSELPPQREEGGGRNKPRGGACSPAPQQESPVDAASASASPGGPPRPPLPDTGKWIERLAGYRPWEGKSLWQPFWGPRPDSMQKPSMIPPGMHRTWLAEYEAAKRRGEAA